MPDFSPRPEHELERLDDEELIAYVRAAYDAGDRRAVAQSLGILVHGHLQNVKRRLRLKLRADLVDDIAGEIILSALESVFRGESVGEFVNWINRIVHRRMVDHYRTQERRPDPAPLDAGTDDDRESPQMPRVEGESGAVEAWMVVEAEMEKLSDTHRQVVVLYGFGGLSAAEAASRIDGMSEENVHQIYSRFRAGLRRGLGGGGDTGP